MSKSWANFEIRVRDIAQNIWSRPCNPRKVGGVNIDGYITYSEEIVILIEITEERTLHKVRGDVTKLQVAKASAFADGKFARCFCVVDGPVTQGMKDAGTSHHISILSIDEFTKMFFAFDVYLSARMEAPFGSSVDPITGDNDQTAYVEVRYNIDGRKGDYSSQNIADMVAGGGNVILLGEYGSGKSRCIREIFNYLSRNADDKFCYPIAIDLRTCWGLTRGNEILRRHFSDLGLSKSEDAVVRAFRNGAIALFLDGFDEIGSQAWSNDVQRLKSMRAKSLEGVKNLLSENKGGSLICGREHYFPSSEEMFATLGLPPAKSVIARCKEEFSDTELLQYFDLRNIDVDLPEWLPRRPLICQTIAQLAKDQFQVMFEQGEGEVKFWSHFIDVLCKRDARIHPSFDPSIIFRIFIYLARVTRSKSADVGSISLAELQAAFESATGAMPVEEASLMLQRLPTLGRLNTESNDRQFVDIYILDGLRALDLADACLVGEAEFTVAASAKWTNPLGDLGQRVLASEQRLSEQSKKDFAGRAIDLGNFVMVSDLVASIMRRKSDTFDFGGMTISNGDFRYLDFRDRSIKNIKIHYSFIGELSLPAKSVEGVEIYECLSSKVTGISSAAALPKWIKKLEADTFDSVENVSRVRKIGLKPQHEILIVIIRKLFFQRGAGRKEEALLRGLGTGASKNISRKIIGLLLKENLITSFRGDEGEVYAPARSYTQRMQLMLDELAASVDPIWSEVEKY